VEPLPELHVTGAATTAVPAVRLLPKFTQSTVDDLIRAGNAPAGRGGVTAAGSALQSHATRAGSYFKGMATNNAATNAALAQSQIGFFIANGNVFVKDTKAWGSVLDIRLPSGAGARFSLDGKRLGADLLRQRKPPRFRAVGGAAPIRIDRFRVASAA
jgi:hypothetical protein